MHDLTVTQHQAVHLKPGSLLCFIRLEKEKKKKKSSVSIPLSAPSPSSRFPLLSLPYPTASFFWMDPLWRLPAGK